MLLFTASLYIGTFLITAACRVIKQQQQQQSKMQQKDTKTPANDLLKWSQYNMQLAEPHQNHICILLSAPDGNFRLQQLKESLEKSRKVKWERGDPTSQSSGHKFGEIGSFTWRIRPSSRMEYLAGSFAISPSLWRASLNKSWEENKSANLQQTNIAYKCSTCMT